MNIAKKYYEIINLFCRLVSIINFYVFQRPLWKFSYTGNGNNFQCKGRLYGCKIYIDGHNNDLTIENKVVLFNTEITITGNNNKVLIGENTCIYENGRIRVQDEGNMVRLGRGVRIIGAFISSADKYTVIDIDDSTLIYSNVIIRSSDSHSIIDSQGKRINNGDNVFIGKNVWIGNGATILKGTTIGDNSVVGTQSLISGKKFPDNTVIVGNPAKIVKEGICWCDQRI